MVDRQLDLDLLAAAADLQLDAARAGNAAAVGDGAGDAAAAAFEQVDVVRAEIQQGLAIGNAAGAASPIGRSAIQTWPFSTVTGRELEFADEAEDEGRVRRVVDVVGACRPARSCPGS